MNKNDVFERLSAFGVRPSEQRVAIYFFLAGSREHPTVDTIFRALSGDHPTLSRTTVYNTLKLFQEKGLALSVPIEDSELRYDADTHAHIHFKCVKCGSVSDVYSAPVAPELPAGFKTISVLTNVYGVCPDCSKD